MNTKPLEQAQDDDLRQSLAAMQRAAQRARELAAQTGTAKEADEPAVDDCAKPAACD